MPSLPAVHPLQPRFAQAITGVLCLEAALFQTWPVVAVALGLVVVAIVAPRRSPVTLLFRLIAPPPRELEPVAPVRFAQGMAAVMLAAALALMAAGLATAGWVVVGLVAAVALFSAISGFCVGCEIYRVLLAARRREATDDLRRDLGLDGAGPWLVVVTAPGCARCEPVARALESAAEGRPVVRVDLARTPAAARLPIRSVPAALAVDRDGELRALRVGRLDQAELAGVVQAV